MTTQTNPQIPEGYKPGLEGVIAGLSAISEVDSNLDALTYRGYAAHELAEKARFSEVAYLLLYGQLPNSKELESFRVEMNKDRELPEFVLSVLKTLPKSMPPMTAFRVAVSCCHMVDPDANDNSLEANYRKAKRLITKSPTIVAAIHRLRSGKEPIAPRHDLRYAENFLYMVSGVEPDPEMSRFFDSTMILYAEHGFNASTFSALVTASTLSDMHSAIGSAIGTLKGPLHGGANEGAIEMLLKIGSADKAESWIKDALARKEKIMGFGHRVYKKQDSRAPWMRELAGKTADKVGDKTLFKLSCEVEDLMKREKNLFPNVDFHCAVFYYLLGLPIEIYTCIFGMARMVGWTSHVVEQHANNRLIRPKSVYTGPRGLKFVPIEER